MCSWMDYIYGDDKPKPKETKVDQEHTMDTFRFRAYTDECPLADGFVFDVDISDVDKTIYLSVVDDKAGKMERWLNDMKDEPQTLVIDFKDDWNNILVRKLYHGATVINVNQKLSWKENAPAHLDAIMEYEYYERIERPKEQA